MRPSGLLAVLAARLAGNLRLQRTLGWLTWALVLIGLATIALVAYQVWGEGT
jgi:hypothetical protein